jgi:hypothetical protein
MKNLLLIRIYSTIFKFLIIDSKQVPRGKGEKELLFRVKRT